MVSFPKSADVVIIGLGGIVGTSVAHHLIEKGWKDIVGIDKSSIPTDIGSTAPASDFCYATSHDYLTTWTTLYSIDFFAVSAGLDVENLLVYFVGVVDPAAPLFDYLNESLPHDLYPERSIQMPIVSISFGLKLREQWSFLGFCSFVLIGD